ncbi:MAG: preprotein translocase subunit SecG [Candidatus Latescibacterota bacterium]|jgi:preprotein translocase subunit SecG
MLILLTIFHVLVCFLLITAVLLQSGKGGGLAAAIGGGLSSSSVLGGRSAATFLSKATTILATTFMISCLAQAIIVRGIDTAPTTATERAMKKGDLPVIPFNEGQPALPAERTPATGESDQALPSAN